MNRISPRNFPFIQFLLIDERVSALEVHRELQQRMIFGIDELASDLLLDDSPAPILVKPWVGDLLLLRMCIQERVLCTRDVQVHLEVDNVIVKRAHCDIPVSCGRHCF